VIVLAYYGIYSLSS